MSVAQVQEAENPTVPFAALLGYLLLLPPQFIVQLNGIVLPPHRIFLIAAFFFVFTRFASDRLRFGMVDLLVLLAAGWIFAALAMTMGVPRALSGGGAQLVDIALSYFFARATIRSLRDMRVFLILLAPGLLATGLLMGIESISQNPIGQNLASSLFGNAPDLAALRPDVRFGLMRAPGPFPHPILAGIFMGSFMALFLLSGIRGWPRLAGMVAAACSIFSLSSAALLALAAAAALSAYDWLVERIGNLSWRLFLLFAGIGLLVAQFATGSGAIGLITRFGSLNEWTGYYRRLIWQYGTASVEQHPLFGIGYAEWVRPAWMTNSVDNFWLLLAMQYGLVPPLALLLAIVIAVVGMGRASSGRSGADRRLSRAIAIALAVFTLGAFSVSLWLSAQVWLFMLLGIAVSLSDARPLQRLRETEAYVPLTA